MEGRRRTARTYPSRLEMRRWVEEEEAEGEGSLGLGLMERTGCLS